MHKLVMAILVFSTMALSNTIVPNTGSDLKITIYNSNLSFVNDKRTVEVEEGKQKLVYEGVPKLVITQSVVPTFTGVKTNLFSQNYVYNLISLQSMLNNSVNKEIEYFTYEEEGKKVFSKGVLLSVSPHVMVQNSKSGKIYTLNSQTQVVFKQVPASMITKPSLIWNVETEAGGKLEIDLKYLTTGISWKSDYVLNLSKDTLDLNGWITVTNNSGVAYNNAQISCLAGDVNRAREVIRNRRVYKSQSSDMLLMEAVKEESFSGYHLYTIPFKESIANKQTKQIVFTKKEKIKYKHYGKSINSRFENYGEMKLIFSNIIEFQNSKENNMGIALPTGIVRMYRKDSKGDTHFIGEQRVHNIPEDETVKLTIGKLFDVVGEKTVSKYIANKHHRNVETTYTIRNQGKEAVELKIEENIPVYGEKITVKTSCKDNCSVKKKNAFVREFTIKLQAKEKYVFTSEFKVNY